MRSPVPMGPQMQTIFVCFGKTGETPWHICGFTTGERVFMPTKLECPQCHSVGETREMPENWVPHEKYVISHRS